MINAITVDVEDYFHPTEIQTGVAPDRWEGLPSRVESSTYAVLELLDRHKVKGTFFILGWVAARKPGLIASIAAAKHEIGCHSFWHRLVYDLKPEEFEQDTRDAVSAIEAACGQRPSVYRAPSFSITQQSMWALDVLASLGFTMDSSIYPIAHDRYGVPGFQRSAQSIATGSGPIMEVPVATVRLGTGRIAPIGGGGYLRLLPYRYTAAGLRKLNLEEGGAGTLYFHPWEVDPDQPRLTKSFISRLRTYTGLRSMASKIDRLLGEFEFAPMRDVYGLRQ